LGKIIRGVELGKGRSLSNNQKELALYLKKPSGITKGFPNLTGRNERDDPPPVGGKGLSWLILGGGFHNQKKRHRGY